MFTALFATRLPACLPKLAVTAVVCWGLGTNTNFDSTNITPALLWLAPSAAENAQASNDAATPLQVLSPKDAKLYEQIFAAQQQSDWKTADADIASLKDQRLLGHVLADRYQHQPATYEQLQAWLEKYADLPEAGEFYNQALALGGRKGANLPTPTSAGVWSGSDTYAISTGFRFTPVDRKATPAARRLIARLNHALHQGKPIAAETLLDGERRHRTLTPEEASNVEGLIAASYFYNGQTTFAHNMAEEGARQQNPLALWIAGLTAWKQGDPRDAGKAFTLLAAQSDLSGWDRAAAAFWASRALKRTGDMKDARYWLERAAQHPHSFYGLMAAQLLGDEASWSWELPKLDDQQLAMLSHQKAGAQALALLQIGQRDLAESELRHINPQGRRDLQEAMLALASDQRMPSLALQLGGVATKTNGEPYDAALYPLPPWEPTNGFTVDRALLFALMKHESQFDPLAVSDRGACGLMQLLPATAKLMSYDGAVKGAHSCSGTLLEPSVNIALGQKYVVNLEEQPLIGDNLLLLLAAYNGGPGKLAHWMHEDDKRSRHPVSHRRTFEKEDPLLFLESMPLRQTHDYVEQVLIHYWYYRARLGENEDSLGELAHGEWPRLKPPEQTRPLPKGTKEAMLTDGRIVLASTQK
jgi:soluble lytic murein transglycosylase-like protein